MNKSLVISWFFIVIFQLFNSTLNSQTIQVSSGLNINKFYDFENDGAPYNRSVYTSKYGGYFAFEIEYLMYDSLPIQIMINYESYGGTASGRSGGIGGGVAVNVETNKSIVSLGVLPFKQKIYKHLNVKFGFLFSMCINETFSGTETTAAGNIPTTKYLNEVTNSFNSKYNFGVLGSIGYNISINQNLILVPHYNYYFGFVKEFQDFPKQTKSMRHSLGIGIKMDL